MTGDRRGGQRQRQRQRARRRGVALIMVLVITTLLAAIAADLANDTQVNVRAAANARDELQAYFHARSALELELFVLRFQGLVKGQLESFIPVPLFELSGFLVSSDTMKGVLKDRDRDPDDARPSDEGDKWLDQPFGDFEGSFWIEDVVDENRKVNLNAVERYGLGCQDLLHAMIAAVIEDPRYDRLFEDLGQSRDPLRNRIDIISNLTDWVDGNEVINTVCILTGERDSQVAEDTRYENLPYGARYKPKNGMFSSLAEVRMVPGVNDAFMQLFSRFFTVWSDSGVSVKTAEPWMLRAILRAIAMGPALPGDEEKVGKFFSELALARAVPGAKLNQPLFEALLATARIGYDSARLTDLVRRGAITFDDVSSVYRITAVGRMNDASSKITVVWRDDRTGRLTPDQLYYWREE